MKNMKKLATLVAPLAALALMLGTAVTASANSTTTTQADPAWGLKRIDGGVDPHSTGQGVNAYIIGSGLNASDPDFGGRASNVYNKYFNNSQDCSDGTQYHDTGVASVLGGNRFGVAKQVNLLGVKAFDCSGDPDAGKFVEAIAWVKADAAQRKVPAVAVIAWNWMAAGYLFGPNAANNIRGAVDDLAASNVFVAVSAGNIDAGKWPYYGSSLPSPYLTVQYAADNPPANAAQAMVVMASDQDNDAILSMSYPKCGKWSTPTHGDIYAPAVDIGMANGDGTYGQHCGTSFGAPMAAGVAALYKATYGEAPSSTVKSWILDHATQNAIRNNPSSATPNRLLSTGGL